MNKTMDLQEFIDEGYLQEANRLFFHPRGLALSVEVNEEGKAIRFGPIWDERDDPEGIIFERIDKEKVARVVAELRKHRQPRLKYLGSVIQDPDTCPGSSQTA